MEATWDGLPVAREPPYASCVVVWREGPLDAKHDAHRWLTLAAAAELCSPATVADGLRAGAATLD